MYKEGVISKDLQQYLIPKYPKNGKLKGNPKLHKDGAPFRTIVSGVNTPTLVIYADISTSRMDFT